MKKYYLLIIGALFLNGCNKNDIKSITCNNENVTELLTQLQEEAVNKPFSKFSKETAKAQLKYFLQDILTMTGQKEQLKLSSIFIEKKMKTKIIYDYFRTDKLDEKAQKRFCIATMKEGSIISLRDNGAFKVPRPLDVHYFIQLTDDKQIYVALFNKK